MRRWTLDWHPEATVHHEQGDIGRDESPPCSLAPAFAALQPSGSPPPPTTTISHGKARAGGGGGGDGGWCVVVFVLVWSSPPQPGVPSRRPFTDRHVQCGFSLVNRARRSDGKRAFSAQQSEAWTATYLVVSGPLRPYQRITPKKEKKTKKSLSAATKMSPLYVIRMGRTGAGLCKSVQCLDRRVFKALCTCYMLHPPMH